MIILDTCAILWDALEPSKLSGKAKRAIESADAGRTLLMSDISLWEIAMLIQRGRVQVNATPASFLHLVLGARHYRVVAVSPEIAERSVAFGEQVNADPADRIILSTAIELQAVLVTADRNLRQAKLAEVLW